MNIADVVIVSITINAVMNAIAFCVWSLIDTRKKYNKSEINMIEFNEWLDDRLNESVGDHYDPNGNSSRAVVCRMKKGLINSIWYECKSVVSDIKLMFTYEWDGFNTNVGWFIQLFLLPVMIWFIPFTRTYVRYKSAIKDYESEYSEAKSRFERDKSKKIIKPTSVGFLLFTI